jgi:hypothetical protein
VAPTRAPAAAIALAAATIGLSVCVSACSSGRHDRQAAATTPAAPSPPRAPLFDCRNHVEGPALAARRGRDLVAGPFAYYRFQENVDSARVQYREEHRSPNVKIVALVEPGREVTLAVPADERDYLELLYTDAGSSPAVTLRACRRYRAVRAALRACGGPPGNACRGASTQFAGGLRLDFAKAGARARCAVLEVWVKGRPAPLRPAIFRDRGGCRSAGA